MIANKKIDSERWYSLTELADGHMFPWLGCDIRRYRRFVGIDRKGKNHLKGMIMGKGKTKRYNFKGENIATFLNLVEAGKFNV